MNLFVVDEAHRALPGGLHLLALTGVLVPAARYDGARRRFYRLLSERRDVGGQHVTTRDGRTFRIADGMHVTEPPPELHGVRLLPERDDDAKIAACERVMAVVAEGGLTVYRACLGLERRTWRQFGSDGERYLHCWHFLVDLLEPVLAREQVAVVLDSGNAEIARTLPRFVQRKQFLRALGPDPAVPWGPDPYANLVGEIGFADSNDAVMVQVADVASYVLLARDALELDPPGAAFKQRIAGVARALPPSALRETRGVYERQGTTYALREFPAAG